MYATGEIISPVLFFANVNYFVFRIHKYISNET